MAEMTAEASRDRSAESLQLEISALEMRMAALAARISAPQKGDRPDLLNQEYEELAAKIRELKKKA